MVPLRKNSGAWLTQLASFTCMLHAHIMLCHITLTDSRNRILRFAIAEEELPVLLMVTSFHIGLTSYPQSLKQLLPSHTHR